MWKSRDPIPTFTTYLRARHVLDDAKLKEIEDQAAHTIDDAVEFASSASDPAAEDAVTDLYA
jgi:pyruvate dehydrogenase E1 component alpha subunit